MARDTYQKSAEEENEIGRRAFESAKGDALGVPLCETCEVRHQHNVDSKYCRRCDPEIDDFSY